jgi:hypothetical protein
MLSFKGAHGVKAILLTWVRGYVASPLSWRQGEERLEGRGGSGRPRDHLPRATAPSPPSQQNWRHNPGKSDWSMLSKIRGMLCHQNRGDPHLGMVGLRT